MEIQELELRSHINAEWCSGLLVIPVVRRRHRSLEQAGLARLASYIGEHHGRFAVSDEYAWIFAYMCGCYTKTCVHSPHPKEESLLWRNYLHSISLPVRYIYFKLACGHVCEIRLS